jgi:ferritin-like metal-binding protein YciE
MSAPESLKDVYVEELRDLWSANDQMQDVLSDLASDAASPKLKSMLERSAAGVAKHTKVLKALVESNDGKASKDHCKGMEGLVKEAKKHALDDKIEDGDVRDVIIISQYQRMSHYGIAGFGAAAAFAKALGLADDKTKLDAAVAEIHKADDAASHLAESAVNLAAKQGAPAHAAAH